MQGPPYDSAGWTGDLNQPRRAGPGCAFGYRPFDLSPHWQSATAGPLYSGEEGRAIAHSILLILSTVLLWLSELVVAAATSGFLVEAPPLARFWPAPLILAFALWFLADRGVSPTLCRSLCMVGTTTVLAASFVYAAAGLYARAHAAGPQMRIQAVRADTYGRRHNRTTITTFALQDGTAAKTDAYPTRDYGSIGRCLAARKLSGPLGFTWLLITDGAPLPPAPGPGQLAWPVQPVGRADCFSARPLSELGGTT